MSETTKKRLEIELQTFKKNIRIRLKSFFSTGCYLKLN